MRAMSVSSVCRIAWYCFWHLLASSINLPGVFIRVRQLSSASYHKEIEGDSLKSVFGNACGLGRVLAKSPRMFRAALNAASCPALTHQAN